MWTHHAPVALLMASLLALVTSAPPSYCHQSPAQLLPELKTSTTTTILSQFLPPSVHTRRKHRVCMTLPIDDVQISTIIDDNWQRSVAKHLSCTPCTPRSTSFIPRTATRRAAWASQSYLTLAPASGASCFIWTSSYPPDCLSGNPI